MAIKMLFYPREERDFVLFKLHGIFPKRQSVLASRLAKIVAYELFTIDNLREKIETEDTKNEIRELIENEVEEYVKFKILDRAPILMTIVDDKRLKKVREKVGREIEESLPKIINHMSEKLDAEDIEAMVYEKVNNYSSEKLEELLMSVLQKELRFIEFAGAVLGFFIGLVQVGIVHFWG